MRVIETIQPTQRIIIAGDFNDWRMQLMGDMEKAGFVEAFSSCYGKLPRTFPAVLPVLPLDRVYARGVTASGARLLHTRRTPLSDHLPYLVDFII